jgi:hypothetical protein
MTEGESTPAIQFKPVGICGNPMEIEIYPATLREKEIPHRTEWESDGRLILMVPDEWRNAAIDALTLAARLFFGESFKPADPDTPRSRAEPVAPADHAAVTDPAPAPAPEEDDDEDSDGDSRLFAGQRLFARESPVATQDLGVRPVWPAWVLASIPGLGLGHLYAGKGRICMHLMMLTAVAVAFFLYSGSWTPLLVIGVPWATDLIFAASHVKEHNRRALAYRRQAAADEKAFLDSL